MNTRTIGLGTLTLLSSMLVGCGDDGGTTNDNCLGGGTHGAPATCGPWADDVPEGGDVRVELQHSGTDGTATAAIHGYFFKDQMPARREIDGPVLLPGTGCTDVSEGVYFDNGAPAAAQAIAATRTYLDAGATVTIGSADQSFTLAKQTDQMDLSSYLVHDIVYLNPSSDGTNVMRNHSYQVTWDGGDLGAVDLAEPTSVTGVSTTSQLYVPANIENLNPSFTTALQIPATGDWTITYDQAPTAADAPPLLAFAAFYDTETGGMTQQCVENATGSMTIPRVLIDKLKPSGVLYFGTFTHVGHLHQARRLDLVGVNCTYQEFVKP